ncbi:MAG: hypothetical protein JJ850_15375 [Kordiimonadaceae bacterium]|nr:hypothetical protein [Kordiimonadaceae bacterium]MBO6569902.1 hypothetical protein [Kordiimonadaceae bacterium]MBO6966002.1 hypothetical protein [Kordiimonadaceae bacterium]
MKNFTIALSLVGLMAASAQAQPASLDDRKAEAKERFLALDTNNSGAVSHDELMAQAATRFSEYDRDGNGILLLEELPLKMPVPPRMQHRMDRMKDRAERRGGEAGRDAIEQRAHDRQPTRMKFMAHMDRDENEQLDLEEFATPLIKRYKHADINGDGTVTESEFDEALERGPRKRRGHGRRMLHGR